MISFNDFVEDTMTVTKVIYMCCLLLQSTFALQLPPSPCPNVFAYEGNAGSDRWHGVITFSTNVELVGMNYKVQLDRPSQLLVSWDGEVRSDDNANYNVFNPFHTQKRGEVVEARIMVKFNPNNGIPGIMQIIINGNTMCSNCKEEYKCGDICHSSPVKCHNGEVEGEDSFTSISTSAAPSTPRSRTSINTFEPIITTEFTPEPNITTEQPATFRPSTSTKPKNDASDDHILSMYPTQPSIIVNISGPGNRSLPVGSIVSLECTAASLKMKPIKISWSKYENNLPAERAFDDGLGHFVVIKAEPTDSGLYICSAYDGETYITKTVKLTVRANITAGNYR